MDSKLGTGGSIKPLACNELTFAFLITCIEDLSVVGITLWLLAHVDSARILKKDL